MKTFIRWSVSWIVRVARATACTTYGEIAELSAGPCQRCVGHAVSGPTVEEKPDYA